MDTATYWGMLDAISEGVVVFGKDRAIMYCNQAFIDLTGFDRADMAGALCHVMQGPDTDPATIRAIEDALRAETSFAGEILNYRKSGEPFWNKLTFDPQYDQDGKVTCFIGVSRDITRFKQAETKASKLERDYQFIIENVLVGVVVLGPDTAIRFANPRAAELLGLEREALMGLSSHDTSWGLIREDGTELPVSEYPANRALTEQVPIRGVVVGYHRPSDGKLMWFVCNALPVRDDSGAVVEVLLNLSDITRVIESENEAQAFRERFELAAEATQDVIFEWNIETGEYWANNAFKTVYGYDPPSHIRLDALEALSAVEADHDFVREFTLDAIQSGKQRYSIDYGFIRPDGSTGHAAVRAVIQRDRAGTAKRIIGTATDIGQLTEAINALEQSEMRFRVIAGNASDVLWDIDLERDRAWATPDWPAKLGVHLDPAQLEGGRWMDFIDPADREDVLASFRDALKSGVTEWEAHYRITGSDGQTVDVAAKAAILRKPDGRASRLLGNVRNITKEKRHQEGYTRARALEAVGQLTGGVAHDFNNLLMIILGNAELLEMASLDREDAESVALIKQAAESAATLTRRLLSFSGQTKLKTERVSLGALVEETAILLRSGLPESTTLRCNVPADVRDPDVDPNGLEQALVNLAMNASDAMPHGGTISVTCENHVVGEDMVPATSDLRPGSYVVISVSDTGHGMPPHVLSRVFEPFFTTKDVGKGTGLGLSTVYGFAKQSGGEVTIYSEEGRGTTVNLYLPTAADAHDDPSEADPSGMLSGSAGGTILVVEDQPEVRAHVERTLARFGYSVATAPDAASALAMLREGRRFDLLYTDIIMPGGMNGQELAEAAAGVDPQMKVLFTSGYPAAAFEHLGLKEQGNVNLLRKPYKAAELKEAVAQMLQR